MDETPSLIVGPAEQRSAMIAGASLAVLGLLAILFPFATGFSLSVLLGVLLLGGALVHVAHALSAASFWGVVWQVALGVLYGVAGVTLLANPVVGLATLTLLVIVFFVVDGIVEIGWAIAGRGANGWLWVLGSGVLSLLLAALLWAGFPSNATWAVGLLLGVNLLSTGLTLIFVGRTGREAPAGEAIGSDRSQET
jgi:uncharacterized membrane protein HdeD (DUF308 family)